MTTTITKDIIQKHGLTIKEFEKIVSILNRNPSLLELGIFSVMWSEHCSYKSSRNLLKKLPTTGDKVIIGPGENAGAIDIGEGLAAVFKIESHNHPSYIEPYNGAATGVGGILRDIFTMGAKPVALLNSLRFGEEGHSRTKFLINGVVSGISDYGNRVGVPTVGGEIYFNKCYNGNILVNAFALGIVKKDGIFKGVAQGEGNPIIYVGSKTGRDGIHGATMASEEFDENSEEKKPTVQVGDPFTEKLLIDACLELMQTDLIVGIQDMGAAGLTCSTIEMPGRGGMGIDLYLEAIPTRQKGMTSYELMLSESQERMLICAKKGEEEKVSNVFKKYDLDVAVVGKVTGSGRVRIFNNDKIEADLPVQELSDAAPVYDRPGEKPSYQDSLNQLDHNSISGPKDYNQIFEKLIHSPALCSKNWIYRQYDHIVGTNTILKPGSDAAVIRIKGTDRAIALSSDCNSLYCNLDPYIGGLSAVAESARNIVCSGALPIALTNCLNFGNPEKPEIMWQFKEALRGITDGVNIFNTPIVSGNVSFYNETNTQSIYPTPVITMVGLLEDYKKLLRQWFREEGDAIVLLGEMKEELGGSEYLRSIHSTETGSPPAINIEKEKDLQTLLLSASSSGILRSAHDCSEGGFAVALAECCISGTNPKGAAVSFDCDMRNDALLFGESQSRVIVSSLKSKVPELISLAKKHKVTATIIGAVGGDILTIKNKNNYLINQQIDTIKNLWEKGFYEFMGE